MAMMVKNAERMDGGVRVELTTRATELRGLWGIG
jgi:hypothetical protein